MQHYFEVYLMGDSLSADQWQTLYQAISQYGGVLTKFEVIMQCTDNVVRFFIGSNQNLGSLSTNIDGVILRPVSKDVIALPAARGKERFVNFVTGGSVMTSLE